MPPASLSRREMLKRTVVAGAVAAWPSAAYGHRAEVTRVATQSAVASFRTLTQAEGATLQAIVARLIPSDQNGPGALEGGAAVYIDRALGGALASALPAYRSGLAALDRHAQVARGDGFAALDPSNQDDLLAALESDDVPGFGAAGASGSAFFEMLRTHTIEGTFSDPAYGGNANFIGWELLGYPGLRTTVPPDLQRIDRMPPARQVSAYDFPAFAAARARRTGGG